MDDHPPRRARLLEFALAAALIGAVSLYLLSALARLQEEAEKARVEAVVRDLDSALLIRQAQLMIGGREQETAALLGQNPVDLFAAPIAGYAGSEGCGVPPAPRPGEWCWDAKARRLFYRPMRAEGLKIAGGGTLLSFSISAPSGAVRPGALRVVPATAYVWRP